MNNLHLSRYPVASVGGITEISAPRERSQEIASSPHLYFKARERAVWPHLASEN